MATVPGDTRHRSGSEVTMVDPRAPRFGQTLTALFLTAGLFLAEPLLVVGVAAVLGTAVLGRSTEREPAAPHRFAKVLGAGTTVLASVLLLVGVPLAGYAVAGLVAVLAGLAAVTDVCIGCRMYREVSFLRRLGVV